VFADGRVLIMDQAAEKAMKRDVRYSTTQLVHDLFP
jgi:hypothetical protein